MDFNGWNLDFMDSGKGCRNRWHLSLRCCSGPVGFRTTFGTKWRKPKANRHELSRMKRLS